MQWGRAHESNPLLTLLEPSQRRRISVLRDLVIVKLEECSLIRVDVSKLPPSITSGLSRMQLSNLPPMGASPDAMLVGQDANGRETRMPVECKAPCPFKHNTGPGQDAAEWSYVETTGEWSVIPAHHYAQCQMSMLATGCDRMLLMQYTPLSTSAYLVQRHDVWAQRLLAWLSLLNTTEIRPINAQVAALLANSLVVARTALIQESLADRRMCTLLGRVDSYNFVDEDPQRFLDS